MIDLLISHGADLSAKTSSGETPFALALNCNNIEVL
jgi:ankyrin repeat protein